MSVAAHPHPLASTAATATGAKEPGSAGRAVSAARVPRVLILQALCKQYRVPLFLSMHRQLSAAGIQLQVAYSAPLAEHRARHDNASLPPELGIEIPCRAFWGGRLFLQFPLREILAADLVIVEHALKHAINVPLLLLCLLRLKRLAFWVHGGTLRHGSAGLPRWLRKRSLLAADWIFAYTAKVASDLAAEGAPRTRITALENAIDLSSFSAALDRVTGAELIAARARLSLPTDARIALFCGSLYPGRGIDFLAAAGDLMAARDPRFHMLVLGAGPLAPELEQRAATRPWLHPLGAIFGDARALYFRLAQVALMPYLTGLGILDAMAAGLPYIVTGTHCFNPEIDYLVDGVTGLMTGDDVNAYARQVAALLNDPPRLHRMSAASRVAASEYSIEKMTERFVSGIQACLRPTAAPGATS